MHSTFRSKLRDSQKVLGVLRSHPVGQYQLAPRPFSRTSCLQFETPSRKPNPPSGSGSHSASLLPNLTSLTSRPAQLGNEIERWINHLSAQGKSLHVWDTISAKDEDGTWRLLPQVRQDLEEVKRWVKENEGDQSLPFAIKIADGRIRALPTQELQQEQESGVAGNVVHNSDISSVDESSALSRTNSGDKSIEIRKATNAPSPSQYIQRELQLPNAITENPLPPRNETIRFHGSAAARRQRAHRSKDKSTSYTLPQWFCSHNVMPKPSERANLESSTPTLTVGSSESSSRKLKLVSPLYDSATTDQSTAMKQIMPASKHYDLEEKGQQLGHNGSGKPSDNDSEGAEPKSESTEQSSRLIQLHNSRKAYYIEEAQHNELVMTAKGRLKPPESGSLDTQPGGIRGHLIIHYAAYDGDFFLDSLIEDIAERLGCNMISIDVQDISNLIISADVDVMIKHEAAMLGYEVYNEIYKDDLIESETHHQIPGEETEEIDDDPAATMPQGVPFMVGKPITIDLKALFSPKPHRRSSSLRSSPAMPDIIGTPGSSKFGPPLFANVVDSILSSVQRREQEITQDTSENDSAKYEKATSVIGQISKKPTLIHIKELRAIQDTNIGKQFLLQLYEQVERRRAHGESIMLIGSECSREGGTSYDHVKISNLQNSEQEEISSPLVITPAQKNAEHDFSSDRTRKLQTINARHLWQMLLSKNVTLDSLKPGFWTQDFFDSLHLADQSYLEKGLWSFSYVQRLAAIIASYDMPNPQHPIAEAAAVIELSDKSKVLWAKQARQEAKNVSKDEEQSGRDQLNKVRAKANKHEKRLLSGVIEATKIRTTFKDIHIPSETVDALQTLTTLSLVRPDAFSYGVLASDRIPGLLLYGPPGTGKTLAAKAVAHESGATMIEVSAADINDMYVGEGEKNVKALFSLARKLSPCIVFLDEADAMFSARSAQGRRVSHRELLNQFLKEWDGMSNDSGSAFIMVATNRPMDLDDAVLRRLPRRLLVDLPTENDRLEILKIHLRNEQLAEDVNLSQLAAKTPFYSGSDLKNVAVTAALNAVREENQLARAHGKDGSSKYPDRRTLTAQHFEKALEEISASISEDMTSLREIKKFDEQYGDKRGKKRKSPKWGFKTAAEADAVLDTIKVRG